VTRVVILTSFRNGIASRCLPLLAEHPNVEVAKIVYCQGHYKNRYRKLRRDVKKILKIGPLGAIVGYRMRSWEAEEPEEDIMDLAARYGIPTATSPRTNADETVEAIASADADLGLSLGNAIIFPKVFRVPRHGMINMHGELLPDFQGAASVIWSVYEGRTETGFTIHQVDRHIDTGPILYQERIPIEFHPTLKETTIATRRLFPSRISPAIADVAANYDRYRERAVVQTGGRSYTTPTHLEFRKMKAENERLHRAATDR
jgi:methionyl-tRNA formyltransferase